MRKFGLIGYPLSHSFSKKYFTEKFEKEGIEGCQYELYEIENALDLKGILASNPELEGINVTIPHKQAVQPMLASLDHSAEKVGAVNVIKVRNGELKGYNSDYYGFKLSLEKMLGETKVEKALVLGTGGASKAVIAALEDMDIEVTLVSRTRSKAAIAYEDVSDEVLDSHKLIVNTTPLGMYPKIDACPQLNYNVISEGHYLYDLVYNPEITLFMQKGLDNGAKAKHGLEMLILQAERSWEIWNEK